MKDTSDSRNGRTGNLGGVCLRSLLALAVLLAVIPAHAQQPNRPASLIGNRFPRMGGRSLTAPGMAGAATASTAAQGASTSDAEASAFNWDGTPVDIVLQAYAERTGKTILKDPQVPQTTITLKSRPGQKLTDEEYLEAIETILEMNQIHLEPYGESFIRALPRKDVRKEGIPLYMDLESLEADAKAGKVTDGKVVSLMITFKNIATEEAQKALEGFKSNSGILLVFERTNSILVTDTKQNIEQMLRIAKAIDVASPVTEVVEYIQIKYANAQEVKQVIDSIVQESMKDQEKNGKSPANRNMPQTSPFQPRTGLLSGGLRRPGQPNQPTAPQNNPSLAITVSDADRGMIRGKVVTIADERSNKILIITNASNMKFFKDVIAALDVPTTPDVQVKVYRLKYAEAEDVSDMINDLIGNSVSSKDSKGNQNQAARTGTSGSVTRGTSTPARMSANQRTGEAKAGELNKDNVTVLADKRINGLVVMARTEDIPTLEQIIESMDIKLSQVLIETVIIEVGLGDGIETGMDWVQHGRQKVQADVKNPMGQAMAYRQRTYTQNGWDGSTRSWTQVFGDTVPQGYTSSGKTQDDDGTVTEWTDTASEFIAKTTKISTDGILNYYSGGTATAIAGGQGGELAYNIAKGVTSNVFGKALNFVFSSDELGISAILQATKSDSRSKYIASPIIMTLDNKEAVINATAMHYLLKGFTSSGNSYSTIAVPDYEQKELGIEIKVTPKINPNGTVMLTVEEKYTQLGANEPIQYSTGTGGDGGLKTVGVPTTITREMSSDVILENNQTVVFGGLTEKSVSESETGIPFLKDIPFIGKWLFGTVSQTETRTELLVFMTPYVLDDAQAAQAEALRRKKTLSDTRPWEDGGWSLSKLADPVSKKELMRRITEEWKKQDEERQTRIDIEKAKVERAKKLKAMSKEERELWLKVHKEELEEDEKDELEERMLDEKSQEALKKLAAEVRAAKLAEAESEIKQAEKDTAAENERAKLDAEKAKESAK